MRLFNMARTKKDEALKLTINDLIRRLQNKPDGEIVNYLMAACSISRRTAIDHLSTFRTRSELGDLKSYGVHEHRWSQAFTSATGLMQECTICGETELIKEATI